MCLVAIAWRAHPHYPLIVAGNRDEFHERPAVAAAWWDEPAQVFGGRDGVAGGGWLAVSRSGRFAVVVNNPQRPPGPAVIASRGHLVRDFVGGAKPSGRFLDAVQVTEHHYAGFCLVVGTPVQLRGFVSPRGASPGRWTLRAGVSVISNSPLEQPAPKAGYLAQAMSACLAGGNFSPALLFAALGRREPVAADDDGHPAGRTPFVVGDHYGTRASTVITVDSAGFCDFEERRFGPGGNPEGSGRERFELTR